MNILTSIAINTTENLVLIFGRNIIYNLGRNYIERTFRDIGGPQRIDPILSQWKVNIRESFDRYFPEDTLRRRVVVFTIPYYCILPFLSIKDDIPAILNSLGRGPGIIAVSIYIIAGSIFFDEVVYSDSVIALILSLPYNILWYRSFIL